MATRDWLLDGGPLKSTLAQNVHFVRTVILLSFYSDPVLMAGSSFFVPLRKGSHTTKSSHSSFSSTVTIMLG